MPSKCIDSGYLVSSYKFPPIVLKLCRCFLHEIFSHLFCFVNLVSFFLHEMLSKCIDTGYLVGATPLTVLHCFETLQMFLPGCACGFGIILEYIFSL